MRTIGSLRSIQSFLNQARTSLQSALFGKSSGDGTPLGHSLPTASLARFCLFRSFRFGARFGACLVLPLQDNGG
jgi:hypothetical protein